MTALLRILQFSFLLTFAAISVAQDNSLLRLAQQLEQQGDPAGAVRLYRQIYNQGERSVLVTSGLTRCLISSGEFEQAIEVYQDLVARNPQAFNYQVELGKAYFLAGKTSQAEALWRTVLETPPPNLVRYRTTAAALLQLGQAERAAAIFKEALQHFPDNNLLLRDLATLYKQQLNYSESTRFFLEYSRFTQNQEAYLRSQLLQMTADSAATVQIFQVVKSYAAKYPQAWVYQELLAGLLIKEKKFAEAYRIYNKLNNDPANLNRWQQFAAEAEAARFYDFAVLALSRLRHLSVQPGQQTLLRHRQAENYYAAAGYAENQARREMYLQKALSLSDSLISQPGNPAADLSRELQADIFSEYYADYDQAVALYRQIIRNNSGSAQAEKVILKLADCLILQKKLPEAGLSLQSIRTPDLQVPAGLELARIDFYRGAVNKALTRLESLSAQAANRDTLVNNVWRLRLFLEEFKSDSAGLIMLGQAALAERLNQAPQALQIYLGLWQKNQAAAVYAGKQAVQLYRQSGHLAEAAALCEDWLARYPESAQADEIHFIAAEIYALAGQEKQALTHYQAILSGYPRSFYLEASREQARRLVRGKGE